ncbi:efflux RND transporter permease subunit [Desulfopila aestuarii]|uniref:Multidrug efflux pump subunit AcrB n=1 Tax=Desulfopila aestuarii DSM 18488 TaxID=1121416 RepID=A0A1M7YCM5_9BACT|nr:efflux RND transporter permease subunit [Desulfopila aestuarii]SHO50375.1 Multidrug efflux pump subunit AcrB [Desulfopila aestuarii DSM 18488]
MNIAELSIKKSTITWVLTLLMLVIGWKSFTNLSMLEDPEFTIKEAVIITPYTGASAAEVEAEVTNVIEKAVQQMGQLRRLESRSSRGLSIVQVTIKDKYDNATLPQVWDELRRKVNDYQSKLPPGAGPSIVNDDFGDVYGVYVAITGKGYDYRDLYEYAKFLQRELLQAKDVKRIELYGNQPEAVYVEMRREKMADLGVSQQDIYNALAAKNLTASAGYLTLGKEFIPVNPTGEFTSEREFGDLLVKGRNAANEPLVFLSDVADIHRDYQYPAEKYLHYNGEPAVGLAISTVAGGNVLVMGKSLKERFKELEVLSPLGMEINTIYLQTDAVISSIKNFLINLAEAILIVIVVLLVFMGVRSGLIIGSVLLVTIMGTFIFMSMMEVTLQRISLGALVIALGMLVDNAIVVTDGMRVKMDSGTDALTAARDIVSQVGTPLLMATLIAICAFAAIGTSQDSTGEYCRTLFSVIFISLGLSWVTAVTTTPLFCKTFLKTKTLTANTSGREPAKDPYAGVFYRLYRNFLARAIRFRWVTLGVVLGLFIMSILGFGQVKNSFFPDSTTPMYLVDFWFPEGTHIDETVNQLKQAEENLRQDENVEDVISFIGGSQIRFLLTYTPEKNYPSFAQILVRLKDYRTIPETLKTVQAKFEAMYPQAIIQTKPFVLGPSTGGKIQLRIYGPDGDELRKLARKAEDILLADPHAKAVRNEWRDKIKVLRPEMADAQARRAGIDRPQIASAMEAAVLGTVAGVYRENDELLPIIARAPEFERTAMNDLGSIQIWSPTAGKMIPMGQVVTDFSISFEDANIWRRNRTKMMRIHADPSEGLPSVLFNRIKPKIEQALGVDVEQKLGEPVAAEEWNSSTLPVKVEDMIPLTTPGYYMAWGGEAEDSANGKAGLAGYIPIFFGLMVLLVLILFNSIKKTLIIWFTVPLAVIGVTAGLLMFQQPFGFMALLGLMSLAGMLIKNAIVLIDQIDLELKEGKEPFQAILNSGVSRLIPVSMAALTTILGMIPLLADAFFVSMAVTIMFGLGFATVLTLVVVPVLYATFYRVPNDA